MMLTGEAGSSMRTRPRATMASMPFGHSEEMSTRMRSTPLGADAGRAQGERIGRKARERLRPVGREAEGEGATQVP